jgi:hypothetical protein
MGLFLPVLLLGLAQPADLPVTANQNQAIPQSDSNAGSPSIPARQFAFTDPNFRELRGTDRIQITPDPDAHPNACLTMRSYYFKRRDGLAPEFVGMTTCDPYPGRILKKINRRPARLVPAN